MSAVSSAVWPSRLWIAKLRSWDGAVAAWDEGLYDAEPYSYFYGNTPDGEFVGSYTCRGVTGWLTWRSITSLVIWRYLQHIYWCWSGNRIIYTHRDRWAACYHCWGWSFVRHVYNSCGTEYCHEKKGAGQYTVKTTGQFHYSWGYGPVKVARDELPVVKITYEVGGAAFWTAW